MEYGLLFGGKSFEHEISIVSAIALKEVLGTQIKAFIFLDGAHKFYLIEPKDMRSQLFSSGQYKKCPELTLKMHGFYTQGLLGSKKTAFDMLINLIHGADGEDGKLASLLDFFSVKFIGPRVEASVLSFNKHFTKMLAKEKGVCTLPYLFLEHHDKNALKAMDYPLIVKPNRLGSSLGIGVIKEDREAAFVLDEVFEFDSEVLIEPFKEGVKEYNLAGCKIQEKGESTFIFSTIEEPQKKDFLSFDQKYLDFGRTAKVAKADLSPVLEEKMRALFKALYDPLFVGAIIRCDFFVIDNEVYLNEINPIPGSLAHYLFEDFARILEHVELPKPTPIPITYNYINQIQKAK
ncbi:D-alanine--D-alanine ligase [Helicobacter sp. NHP19-003]|uniref:D-alanine--D-alanine ligase n=1 Tax=Helicobacter gastrocanis TaxID=2849641 RepID=A0ABN6I006_9HELI|nr:D-alanine--D-alanine ligase [Helicobacter sp. NHP19-003]BCZ16958.1 D-alanine--D-alanine ligase [Helicobacter sp. NHP19-003]